MAAKHLSSMAVAASRIPSSHHGTTAAKSRYPSSSSSRVSLRSFRRSFCRQRQGTRLAAEAEPKVEIYSPEDGPATYAPESFKELMQDVYKASQSAMEKGYKNLEVQFPPLPESTSSYSGSSAEYINANIQLALDLAKNLAADGKNARIVVPDSVEFESTLERYKTAFDMEENVFLGSLEDGARASGNYFSSFRYQFSKITSPDLPREEDLNREAALADVHIVLNASTVELSAVKKYSEVVAKDKTLILFNLELDTLRGDLGNLGFPPKSIHYSFLSKFLPIFYLRPRDYSKTVSVAPFLLNYSGALLRIYPGPWQAMYKQNRRYVCVAESDTRYSLQDFKNELLEALNLAEEKGSTMEFLRQGYTKGTWWEVNTEEEESSIWRS